jgi:hypothetical protein
MDTLSRKQHTKKPTRLVGVGATLMVCAGLLLGVAARAQSPGQPILLIAPTKVGWNNSDYRNPAVASPEAGRVTVVVESGPIGQRRLVLLEVSGGWGNPARIDLSGPGDCRNPALAFDTSGTLHLVWSENINDHYAIRYATCTASKAWVDHGTLSATPGLDCDFPSIAFDARQRLWIAWQAGIATQSGIYLVRGEAGQAPSAPIDVTGENGDHHNLAPQLLPDSPYPLVWYEEMGTDLVLRSAVETDLDGFQILTPLDFDELDTSQQPLIFQAPSGMLGGIWTDLIEGRERVLLGLQDQIFLGRGLVAEATVSSDAACPSAAAVGETAIALSWISRTPAGSQIAIGGCGLNGEPGPVETLTVSFDGTVTRPHLVVDGSIVHCIWISDASKGGTGELFYAAFFFKQ